MEQMQTLNSKKDTATNPMIMFLVLNTSGLTLIPVSILVYRAQMGAAQPTDVFIPILLATFFATLAGIIITCLYQRINLFNRYIFLMFFVIAVFVAALFTCMAGMNEKEMQQFCRVLTSVMIIGAIMLMLFIPGAFFIPEGTYRTERLILPGTTHIVLAAIPAPKDPPKRLILLYPSFLITSAAHFP
jgi:spore maturation protein SpmA